MLCFTDVSLMLIPGIGNSAVQRSWHFQQLCSGGKANLLPALAGTGC